MKVAESDSFSNVILENAHNDRYAVNFDHLPEDSRRRFESVPDLSSKEYKDMQLLRDFRFNIRIIG